MNLANFLNPTAEDLRQQASEADDRANAAQRDRDMADALKWAQKAKELRRRARAIEFGS